jgi:hypothetical protein
MFRADGNKKYEGQFAKSYATEQSCSILQLRR